MVATFVLPLYPLEGRVLFPGHDLRVQGPPEASAAALRKAEAYGGAVIASLADGASVHEVAVTALVSRLDEDEVNLHGVARCKLLALVDDETPLVRAERLADSPAPADRAAHLAALLLARYEKLCRALGRPCPPAGKSPELAALTWNVTAELRFSAEQQQGFLNVPDAVTRGRLLLVAVRELERRERFLRPWAHLRAAAAWN
jgi:Lon protease-like protein